MSTIPKYIAIVILVWMPVASPAHPEPKKEDAVFVELQSILSTPRSYKNQYIKTKGYFLYSEDSKQFVLAESNTIELSPEAVINNEVLTLASAVLSNQSARAENMSFVGSEVKVYGTVNIWEYDPIIVVLGEVKIEN